ncbi:MAG TPA: hypothetical protein VKM55_30210 [Candidatus Lokiarchaeia archaeon]|nr:hypothetical protein [Candidatus Lokiarchaeia archaeon]
MGGKKTQEEQHEEPQGEETAEEIQEKRNVEQETRNKEQDKKNKIQESRNKEQEKSNLPPKRVILRDFSKGIFFYPLAIYSFIAFFIYPIGILRATKCLNGRNSREIRLR